MTTKPRSSLRVSAKVQRKKTGMVFLQHDESRALALEDMAGGEAEWETGKRLGLSREVVKGYWLSADVHASCRISCAQTEKGLRAAANITDELTEEAAMEWLERCAGRMEEIQADLMKSLPTGDY